MQYNTILYDRYGTDDRIGRITFNRPEKLNALNAEMLSELEQALKAAAWDDSVRVIVIRGSGRGFGAGYDLSPPSAGNRAAAKVPMSRVTASRKDFQEGVRRQLFLFNLPKVTIAQVHGYCLAGSCEHAMMCDLVIAAEDATIGHPGIRGLGPPRNSCIWPMVIGMRRAKELLYTGDTLSGTQAAAIEMINRAAPADKLEEEVTKLAERVSIQHADSLAIHKEAANRWYQTMGMESSAMAAADYDYLYQHSSSAVELRAKIGELGLKEAFTWRDTPYQDLGANKKATKH